MIEIIQSRDLPHSDVHDNKDGEAEGSLPKNFRQIGTPTGGKRIYIEDYVYTYLHPAFAEATERRICILLGKVEQAAGYLCLFVSGAIELKGVMYCGNAPIFSEATRAEICMQIKRYFDGCNLLGWFYDAKGIPPKLTPEIERVQKNFFGGTNRILLLSDSLEREEEIFLYEDNATRKKDGYYIYYESNHQMQEYMIASRQMNQEEVLPEVVKDEALKNYRQMLLSRQHRKLPAWNSVLYSTGLLMVIAVCVIGIAMFGNYQKMKNIESAVAVMAQSFSDTEADTEQTTLIIEEIEGKVEPESGTETPTTADGTQSPDSATTQDGAQTPGTPDGTQTPDSAITPDATQPPATTDGTQSPDNTTQPASTEPLSEAQTILLQGYYIVQPGDSMLSISKKIYQDASHVDAICAANGIDNVDKIYIGQKLILPS